MATRLTITIASLFRPFSMIFFTSLFLTCAWAAALPTKNVTLEIGALTGQPTSNGVLRYSLKYATAKRWSSPVMSTTLFPSNTLNATTLPLSCPQPGLYPSQFSEDCLYVVLYVPPCAKVTRKGVPTIVWVHGGSFMAGSATGPGLDGSNLAVATCAIVAVVQYRLGVLGLLPPSASSSTNNLAVQDLMTALKFLHQNLPFFGGTPRTPHLTLAGQSSGATLVRALLGTTAAAPLFSNAWLHSDPIDYGFLSPSALATLRTAWISELGCSSGSGCGKNMDVPTLLSHQTALFNKSTSLGPEFFESVPLRPSLGGPLISETLTKMGSFPSSGSRKPIVLSTVRDEGMTTVYSMFPEVLPPAAFKIAVTGLLGSNRTNRIFSSNFYTTNSSDARVPLQVLGTDLVWRCATWRLARNWVPAQSFVGVFTEGVTFPGNEICQKMGGVCHQDDIFVLFGTGGQDSAAVRALTREVQGRYAAFVRSGNPNGPGLTSWEAATSAEVRAHNLGGIREIPVGACEPSFWGEMVPFDYQILKEE